jgi:hypothetical protein
MPSVGSGSRQEDPHASTSIRQSPPPRPTGPTRPLQLSELWWALSADHRDRILAALSRVVAAHLTRSPRPQEVTHEQP